MSRHESDREPAAESKSIGAIRQKITVHAVSLGVPCGFAIFRAAELLSLLEQNKNNVKRNVDFRQLARRTKMLEAVGEMSSINVRCPTNFDA